MTALYDQLLADDGATHIYLVEIDGTDESGDSVSLYFSTSRYTTLPSDSPPHRRYVDILAEPISVNRSLYRPESIGGRSMADFGEIVLKNLDGVCDQYRRHAFGRVIVRHGGILSNGQALAFADYAEIFSGTAAGPMEPNLADARLRIRSNRYKLDREFHASLYRGMSHCLAFDGVAQYLTLGSHTSVAATAFEAWVRCDGPNTAADSQLVAAHHNGWADATIDWYVYIDPVTGFVSATIHRTDATALSLTGGVDVRDGKFRHVALRLTATEAELIVDREVVDSGTPPAFAAITGTLYVGTNTVAGDFFFHGRQDEIRFWKVNRTAAEIAANANRELQRPNPAAMHGYWKLNENLGTSPLDSSGNGKTGAFGAGAAAPTWSSSLSGTADLAGTAIPIGVGTVRNFEAVCIDPSRRLWQFHDGHGTGYPALGVTTYDNADTLGGTVPDLERGIVELAAEPRGRVTVDFYGANLFGSSAYFSGAGGGAATVTCPAGSMALEVMVHPDAATPASQALAGYRNGTAAGLRLLYFQGTGDNNLTFAVRNDAGTLFESFGGTLRPSWRVVHGVLDTVSATIRVVADGVTIGTPTAVTGTFNTVLSAFAIGRLADSASLYLSGKLDEVCIWSIAPTDAEIAELINDPKSGSESGLVRRWGLDENTGTTAIDSVAGTVMTLSSFAWHPSRRSAADLSKWAMVERGGVDPAAIDPEGRRLLNSASPGSCGFVVSDAATKNSLVVDALIDGVGGFWCDRRGGGFLFGAFTDPDGGDAGQVKYSGGVATPLTDPVAEFDEDQIFSIEPVPVAPPVWRVLVNGNRNWSPFDKDEVAGILEDDPERFSFFTEQWRTGDAKDEAILERYPEARVLIVNSTLDNIADLQDLADALLLIYGRQRQMDRITLHAAGYAADVSDIVTITFPRLMFDAGRVVRVSGDQTSGAAGRVTLDGWS